MAAVTNIVVGIIAEALEMKRLDIVIEGTYYNSMVFTTGYSPKFKAPKSGAPSLLCSHVYQRYTPVLSRPKDSFVVH